MESSHQRLRQRTYNVQALSFTPAELAAAIQTFLPNFKMHYEVCPTRQAIGTSHH